VSATDLLIVAGEASGDLHAARMLTELRALVPGTHAFGMGGDELAAAGFEALAESREIAVVGLTEALKILPKARRIFRRLLAEVERRGTRVAVLVDSPDFNLRLARQLHRRGVRVIYYVSPQVWAWRKGRVKSIERYVDRMLVLFPFEVEFYRAHGVEVAHVGHPLIDEVPRLEHVWDAGAPGGRILLSLLPGSRASEVGAMLPDMRRCVELLAQELDLAVQLIQAPTVDPQIFDAALDGLGVEVRRVRARRFEALAESHFALCASGTATLETALVGTPMVVVYRVHRWSAMLGRLLVDVPYASMVNLVLGREAVPELLQEDCEPRKVAATVTRLLASPAEIEAMRASYRELRRRLGGGGASRNAAAEVARQMGFEVEP
jgi:lipid-A-disaccharide synthase